MTSLRIWIRAHSTILVLGAALFGLQVWSSSDSFTRPIPWGSDFVSVAAIALVLYFLSGIFYMLISVLLMLTPSSWGIDAFCTGLELSRRATTRITLCVFAGVILAWTGHLTVTLHPLSFAFAFIRAPSP